MEENNLVYILVEPGCLADIQSSKEDFMLYRLIGDHPEDLAGIPYKGSTILYNSKGGEFDWPMNRFLTLEDMRIMAVCGSLVIVNGDKDGYSSPTDEQVKAFMEEFKYPHKFVTMFGKLFIFEQRNLTEYNLIQAIDIDTQEAEDGNESEC